jgi:hypothetical protein
VHPTGKKKIQGHETTYICEVLKTHLSQGFREERTFAKLLSHPFPKRCRQVVKVAQTANPATAKKSRTRRRQRKFWQRTRPIRSSLNPQHAISHPSILASKRPRRRSTPTTQSRISPRPSLHIHHTRPRRFHRTERRPTHRPPGQRYCCGFTHARGSS